MIIKKEKIIEGIRVFLFLFISSAIITLLTACEYNAVESSKSIESILEEGSKQAQALNKDKYNNIITEEDEKIIVNTHELESLVSELFNLALDYTNTEATRINSMLPRPNEDDSFIDNNIKLAQEENFSISLDKSSALFSELKEELRQQGNLELVKQIENIQNNVSFIEKSTNGEHKIAVSEEVSNKINELVNEANRLNNLNRSK